jgi:hypothetical protein
MIPNFISIAIWSVVSMLSRDTKDVSKTHFFIIIMMFHGSCYISPCIANWKHESLSGSFVLMHIYLWTAISSCPFPSPIFEQQSLPAHFLLLSLNSNLFLPISFSLIDGNEWLH